MADPIDAPGLPCPECRMRGAGGGARIGNRRNQCTTCNNFAQNIMRLTRKALMEKYSEDYMALRLKAELDLYPQVIERFLSEHPESLRGARR